MISEHCTEDRELGLEVFYMGDYKILSGKIINKILPSTDVDIKSIYSIEHLTELLEEHFELGVKMGVAIVEKKQEDKIIQIWEEQGESQRVVRALKNLKAKCETTDLLNTLHIQPNKKTD